MPGFEGDPFGPPTVDNPFEDAAVQQVAKQTSSVQRGLEDYNPFDDQPNQNTTTRGGANQQSLPDYNADVTQPAVMQPTQENVPPPYTRTPQSSNMTATDFQRRQEELEKKAAELQRREDELRNASVNVRRNNWPPLPANFCGLEPCFYQDINVEIPVDFQNVVRQLYNLWIFHTILMAANIFGSLLLLLENGAFETFALSIFFVLLFTPFSFLCWYRPGYKAFRDDSSFNFMVFFFIFFFQFIISVMQTLGFPGTGTCGLYVAIKCFNGTVFGTITGILLLSIALGFGAAALLDLFLLSKIHKIYRSSGASMAKAQAEFTSGILRNEHVRQAATSAASAAVQAQFQPDQPRY